MNKHFEDSRYYLRRATETAAKGLGEEIAAVEVRLREMTGREAEAESDSGRLDEIRADLERLQERAEGEAREAIGKARERLASYQAAEAEKAEA